MGALAAASAGGLGVAVKSSDGSFRAATVGLIEALRRLGFFSKTALDSLERFARPAVTGGTSNVGRWEPALGEPEE